MIIPDIKPFVGQHCETTATGTILKNMGIELSEPMLFGLGEGLGFIYWNMKTMGFPFLGGRIKPDLLTQNICRNLSLVLEAKQTKSRAKAWENVAEQLDNGKVVGLKLDCYHLEYFSNKIHFAGHYAAMYGYDDAYAYLVDTNQQGLDVKTSLESLALARSEKGPMSSDNRSYTITSAGKPYDLKHVIPAAILRNATDFLNPPIKNIGYKGILKTSEEVIPWFNRSKNIKRDFQTTAMLMERAGTGGSIFRNLYRDFLEESYKLIGLKALKTAHEQFVPIALQWKDVSECFFEAGETNNISYIKQASEMLAKLSRLEQSAMSELKEELSGAA